CQWLQELHSVGLLRGSFRPTAAIAALRAYLRHRETLVQSAATHVQRMQKALLQMNLQLSTVISDITGVTGLRIVRDIMPGQPDPRALAQHRDARCQASEPRYRPRSSRRSHQACRDLLDRHGTRSWSQAPGSRLAAARRSGPPQA